MKNFSTLQAAAHELLTRIAFQLLRRGLRVARFHPLLLGCQRCRGLAAQTIAHEALARVTSEFLIARLGITGLHEFLLRRQSIG